MPKVGNKTFPYTAKGIDDAKKEKKRIAAGKVMPRKASPKRKYDPMDPTVYIMPKGAAPRKVVPKGTKTAPSLSSTKPFNVRPAKPAPRRTSEYTYKAADGSLQKYKNTPAYQKKLGNAAAGKQAAAEKKAKKK